MQLRRKNNLPHLRRQKSREDVNGTAKELDISNKCRKPRPGRVSSSDLCVLFLAGVCFTVYLSINAVYIGPNLRADQRALIDGNDSGNSHGMIKKPNDYGYDIGRLLLT